ncbi:MAG: flagellin [Acidobacteria bacterium]|nr:MAG: flagellin [Acidobacteriota bacterium]
MSMSILNNIPALAAQNALSVNQANLQSTLFQLSTGKRINSGADDAAGLAIANGLQANITALNQSSQNVNDGIGQLQVVDGSLGQVTNLLNRAVTLATEASNGTETSTQRSALDAEFTSIKNEITNIGANTNFNGSNVFVSSTTSIFLSDASSNYTIGMTVGTLSSSNIQGGSTSGLTAVNLSTDNLTTSAGATTALTDINKAITNVASKRGEVGATVNQLQAATNVISTQIQNLTSAESGIMDANIPQVVGQMSQQSILAQTGVASLAQANSMQSLVLKLIP